MFRAGLLVIDLRVQTSSYKDLRWATYLAHHSSVYDLRDWKPMNDLRKPVGSGEGDSKDLD